MLYIWPVIFFFSWPVILQPLYTKVARSFKTKQFNLSELPRIWLLAIFTLVGLGIVHYNTIIHPFTLADNRHYVFYVFRILKSHWLVKYLAVPAYVLCGWLAIAATKQHVMSSGTKRNKQPADARAYQDGFFLVWLASSALSLVTAPLVEPRYFILPWLIWRLQVAVSGSNIKPASSTSPHLWLAIETIWCLLINIATGYIFLNWTFEWPQEAGAKQRFMW
jgi:alpha-1,2-glucosyltransferase